MNENHANEPVVLESPAPLDDGGKKYNSIYIGSILIMFLFCMIFGNGGLFSGLLGSIVLGAVAGLTIKEVVLSFALGKLPALKFAVTKKIPYDQIIKDLQPVLLPMGMTIEKNKDGSISITYKNIIYDISYNEDDTFSIDWNQSVLGSFFSISGNVTNYRKVIVAMGIIGYYTQQICNGNPPEITAGTAASASQRKSVIFCTKCGYKNNIDNSFCIKCGNPLSTADKQNQTYAEPNLANAKHKMGKKNAFAVKILGFIILAGIVLYFFSTAEEQKYIKSVKNGHPEIYENISYGQAFDSFFSDPEWEYFESADGDDVVQFSGGCTYQGSEVTATIQFILDYENGTFETGAFDMNGVPQNQFMTYAIITKVFDDYGSDNPDHLIDIE